MFRRHKTIQTMDTLSLVNKVAIITGGSSGIGAATAILFVRRGAKVAINGRNIDRLNAVAEKCKKACGQSDRVLIVVGDLTTESCRKEIVDKTVDHFGRLDVLVNNAGALAAEPLRNITEAGIDAMMDLMFKAPIFLSKIALPHLKKSQGNIVNVSTSITTENMPGFFSYTASKAALDHFTEYAALEFRPVGIRVNAVKPGITETAIFDDVLGGDKKTVRGFLDGQKNHTMQGRNGQPEDMAEMIAFLASDAASHITAQNIRVDGGRSKYFHHGQKMEVASLDDL